MCRNPDCRSLNRGQSNIQPRTIKVSSLHDTICLHAPFQVTGPSHSSTDVTTSISVSADSVKREPVNLLSSEPLFPNNVHRLHWVFFIFWTGWLIPCFACLVYKVHSVTTWTLYPVFAWNLTISLISGKTKKLCSREISWGSDTLFAFANMLQHVTINDAKPDIWTPGVHVGKDLIAAVTVGPDTWTQK